jgi:HlyD family secretion protein
MKRIAVIIGLIVLAGGISVAGYWYLKNQNQRLQYKTDKVQKGALSSQVIATGTVNPVTLVQVGSQVSGAIITLYADFNSVVRQGQVIARIDPALFQAKVDQGEADLKNARAVLEKEKTSLADNLRTLNRFKTLFQGELVAQTDLDQAQTKYDLSLSAIKTAQAQIETAQANLSSARTNLNYTTIRSPVNGTVVARNVDVGQTVAASLQAPTLFTIAQDLKEMQVDTNVDEADIGRVKVGQAATFTVDSYPGEPFSAQVSQVRNAPTTVQNVVTYDVVLRVKNSELKLKPGMTANVSLTIEEKEDVLKVPNAALRFKPPRKEGAVPSDVKKQKKGSVVWVLSPENKPTPVPLKSGITDGQFTEIVGDKLKEGDAVITELVQNNKKAEAKGPQGQTTGPMRGMRF